MTDLKIACLNVGYNVMANVVSGSESKFVEKCQDYYPKNNGWSNSEKKMSMCSFNAAKFLSDYDLFGIQEVNSKYKEKFLNVIKETSMDKRFEFISSIYHGKTYITTGYDRDKIGTGILISEQKINSKTDSRVIQFIWFEKISLLFINLHAPHNINLKYEIEAICKNVYLNVIPKKIIMVGDFNDSSGKLKSLNIFNKEIRIPRHSVVPKTCCIDTNYKYIGDYILTSDFNNKNLYFGLPQKYNRKTNLFSDHDPVVLL